VSDDGERDRRHSHRGGAERRVQSEIPDPRHDSYHHACPSLSLPTTRLCTAHPADHPELHCDVIAVMCPQASVRSAANAKSFCTGFLARHSMQAVKLFESEIKRGPAAYSASAIVMYPCCALRCQRGKTGARTRAGQRPGTERDAANVATDT
jgi:hypothetical protein